MSTLFAFIMLVHPFLEGAQAADSRAEAGLLSAERKGSESESPDLRSAQSSAVSGGTAEAKTPTGGVGLSVSDSPETVKKNPASWDANLYYPDGLKKWTPEDSIAVRYLAGDRIFSADGGGDHVRGPRIVVSPDGRYFFVRTFRGDLASDQNIQELLVFSSEDLKQAFSRPAGLLSQIPQPAGKLTFRSDSSDNGLQPITAARWEDGHTIVFTGVQQPGSAAIYRFDVRSAALKRVTGEEQSLVTNNNYDADQPAFQLRGGSIIYTATVSWRPASTGYPLISLDHVSLNQWRKPGEEIRNVYACDAKGVCVELKPEDPGLALVSSRVASISRDGRWAVMQAVRQTVPVSGIANEGNNAYAPRPLLFDLRTGRGRVMVDASSGAAEYLWSKDGAHVVLVNNALPVTKNNPERRNSAYVVSFDLKTGEWSIIEPHETPDRTLTGLGWLKGTQGLLIEHVTTAGKAAPPTVYSLQGRRWVKRNVKNARLDFDLSESESPQSLPMEEYLEWAKRDEDQGYEALLADGISVRVRESINEPPNIVASRGSRDIALLEPDPALRGIWLAQIQDVQWPEEYLNRTGSGGLMLPRDYDPAHPPPLVIQPYDFQVKSFGLNTRDHFGPDGVSSTVYAAQALAAQGIAVLQMRLPHYDEPEPTRFTLKETAEDMARFVQRLDASIEALAQQRLIDSDRVGLIGFFIGSSYSSYALTHPGRARLSATILTNPNYSFYDYLKTPTDPYAIGSHGGGTFWKNKAAWLEHDVMFNIDRVRSPVMMLSNISWMEDAILMRTALQENGLPVTAFSLPSVPLGEVQLMRPRERQAAMQMSVDWMRFWLLADQDPDPSKAKMYVGWQDMRRQWQTRQAQEKAATSQAPRVVQ